VSRTADSGDQGGTIPEDLSVAELAELEAGTGAPLSYNMARLDVVVAALICAAAAALAIIMPQLVVSGGIIIPRSYTSLAPSVIPRLAFGSLALVAAVATVSAWSRLRAGGFGRPADEGDRFRRTAIMAMIVLFYALTVTWLGFIPSTMIVAAATAFFLGLRNPLAFVPGVIIVPVAARFIFERLLLISLPRSHIESIGHLEDLLMRFLVDLLLR
jgi:hypothetical protein